MTEVSGSRRTFVGGAVAGIAALGAMAWLGRDDDGAIVAPQATTPQRDAQVATKVAAPSPEIAAWVAAIGQTVRVSSSALGVTGTIDMIYNLRVRGKLPANARQNPFMVHFLVDRAGVPAGDNVFTVDTPVEGLTQLLMKRGDDRGDKALLIAIFA